MLLFETNKSNNRKKILENFFFTFDHEKTVLDRKITRFWCSKKPVLDRIPRYKRTALQEDCLYYIILRIIRNSNFKIWQTPNRRMWYIGH